MSTFPDLIDLNDYVGRVRYLIDENSEKNFSTAQIITSLNIKARDLQNEMISIAPQAGFFERPADLNPNGSPPGTVSGVQEYTLPADFKRFKRVAHGDTDAPLDPMDLNERFTGFGTTLAPFTGLAAAYNVGPQFYYVTGAGANRTIGFVPIPQGAYPIRMQYVYVIPLLQFGNDVSEIPLEYRDLMCIDAAIDCVTKDEGTLGNLTQLRNTAHVNMVGSISDSQTQLPQQVTRTGRSW